MEGGGTPTRMDVIGAGAPPPGGRRQLTQDRPTYDIGPEHARMFLIDGANSTSLKGVNPFIFQKAIDGFVGKVEGPEAQIKLGPPTLNILYTREPSPQKNGIRMWRANWTYT